MEQYYREEYSLKQFFFIMTGKVEVSVASFNGRLHLLVKLQQLV